MGKRELLLVVGFLMVGAVVYHATAPASGPNERSLSISRLIEAARREVRGNRASTELATTSTIPLDPEVNEIRVIGYVGEVEINGEDRDDVEATLRVHSRAYDEDEAKRYAHQTVLKRDRAGASLTLEIDYVEGRHTGQQRARLALKVPSRLRARIESRPGRLTIADIAGVEATNSGGETSIKGISGRVTVTHRGGTLVIADVTTLRLTSRSADVKLTQIRNDASLILEQGGDTVASQLGGAVDLECRNTDVVLENLQSARGPIRVNATNGDLTLKGLKSEARIDGRNTGLTIDMAAPANVAIYNDGEEVTLTPPPGGFRLDAVVVDGRIGPETLIKNLGLELAGGDEGKEWRISGAVAGGGPTITVRTTRGDLTLAEREKAEKIEK